MDFIVPAAVIFYIVSAVIGAVLKGLSEKPKQSTSPTREGQSVFPQNDPEIMTVFDMAQPEFSNAESRHNEEETTRTEHGSYTPSDYLTSKSEFEQNEDELRTLQTQHTKSIQDLSQTDMKLNRSRLAEAIIMSEVVREPRAKRPWPQR